MLRPQPPTDDSPVNAIFNTMLAKLPFRRIPTLDPNIRPQYLIQITASVGKSSSLSAKPRLKLRRLIAQWVSRIA